MYLAKFIRDNEAHILGDWEESVRAQGAVPGSMDVRTLRSLAQDALVRTVHALELSRETAATEAHSARRPGIDEAVVVLPALRTSVLRQCLQADGARDEELVLFNAIVDRLLADVIGMRANHDHLTGVPNRRLFTDRLDQDIRLVRRNGALLALLYVDLDGFRSANDQLGHAGGDTLLQQAAQRIRSCIRDTDTVARMGGDEFTVILMDAGDRTHVEAVARAILTRLSRPYAIEGQTMRIGGSVGIALHPEHGETVDELLQHAGKAMRSAKMKGGDRFSFSVPSGRPRMRAVEAAGERDRQ